MLLEGNKSLSSRGYFEFPLNSKIKSSTDFPRVSGKKYEETMLMVDMKANKSITDC